MESVETVATTSENGDNSLRKQDDDVLKLQERLSQIKIKICKTDSGGNSVEVEGDGQVKSTKPDLEDEQDDNLDEIPLNFRRPKSKSLPGEMIEVMIHENYLLQARVDEVAPPHAAVIPRRKTSYPAEGYMPMRLRKNSIPEEEEPLEQCLQVAEKLGPTLLPYEIVSSPRQRSKFQRKKIDKENQEISTEPEQPGEVKKVVKQDKPPAEKREQTSAPKQAKKKVLKRKNTPASLPTVSKLDVKAKTSTLETDLSEEAELKDDESHSEYEDDNDDELGAVGGKVES